MVARSCSFGMRLREHLNNASADRLCLLIEEGGC
jgi:hypothetical protein